MSAAHIQPPAATQAVQTPAPVSPELAASAELNASLDLVDEQERRARSGLPPLDDQQCAVFRQVATGRHIRSQVHRDKLLQLPDVEAITGLKKSTLYLLMRRGEFVRCVQVTPRRVAWPESAVLQWVQDRIASAQRPQGDKQ